MLFSSYKLYIDNNFMFNLMTLLTFALISKGLILAVLRELLYVC